MVAATDDPNLVSDSDGGAARCRKAYRPPPRVCGDVNAVTKTHCHGRTHTCPVHHMVQSLYEDHEADVHRAGAYSGRTWRTHTSIYN